VDLGLAGTERPIKGNPGVGNSGRPSAPRRRLLSRVIVAATATVLCTLGLSAVAGQAARAAAAPTVTSVSPSEGVATGGIHVTITGSGFTGATAVVFGSTDEAFTVVSDTEITAVESAQPVGTVVDVTVVTPDGTSAVTPADQFTFVPGTEITGISPAAGSIDGGNTITITGTGFTGTTFVVFQQFVGSTSHTRAASFTVDSDTQITATVPPAPGGVSGNAIINLLTPIGNDPAGPLTFYRYVGPAVTSVSNAFGLVTGGTTVSIKGTGFTSGSTVHFGSTPATSVTVLSSTSLSVVTPPGSPGPVDVTVTTPDGITSPISNGDRFTYVALPTVTGVSPAAGPTAGGNTVTITGTGFQNIFGFPGVTTVDFGSVPAPSFTVDSDTQLTATVPPGSAGTADITALTWLGATTATSAADRYTYQIPCTTTITGTNATPLDVTSGLTCLVNATQNGQVTVAAGAALSVTDSTVNGTVTATSPAGITYCGSTEDGGLTVTGATSPVILGGTLADGTACAADTIPGAVTVTGATAPVTVTGLQQNGTLTLENDTAGVTLDGSQLNGRAYVENNTATAPAVITVSGNTVTGSLYCTGNNPAPADNGSVNTVSGTASDQCAGIAER
jgi:IPT/TIG domain